MSWTPSAPIFDVSFLTTDTPTLCFFSVDSWHDLAMITFPDIPFVPIDCVAGTNLPYNTTEFRNSLPACVSRVHRRPCSPNARVFSLAMLGSSIPRSLIFSFSCALSRACLA
jgi:hypothetical protein